MYGSEAWAITKALARQLDAFYTWSLRKILQIPYKLLDTLPTLLSRRLLAALQFQVLLKQEFSASLATWHVQIPGKIITELSVRRFDHQETGGDLHSAHVSPGWGGLMPMYSRQKHRYPLSLEEGQWTCSLASGDTPLGARHWRRRSCNCLSAGTNYDGIPWANDDDGPAAVATDCCEVCLVSSCYARITLVLSRHRSTHVGMWMTTVSEHHWYVAAAVLNNSRLTRLLQCFYVGIFAVFNLCILAMSFY